MAQLKVPVVINLSKDSVASPVYVPFEIRLGLTSELELRLFHRRQAAYASKAAAMSTTTSPWACSTRS